MFCRYGILNGLIDSREVRRQRGASSSQNTQFGSSCTSWQDEELARLRREVAQRDAYYAEYIASQQAQFTSILTEKLQVSMNYRRY